MKKLLIVFSLALTVEAMACINLSGTYTCKTPEVPGGDPQTIAVEQTEKTYTETMILEDGTENSEQYIIDGKSRRGAFGIWYKASCEANSALVLKVRSPLLTSSAVIEFVPTKDGFTKLRSENGKPKKEFVICTAQ